MSLDGRLYFDSASEPFEIPDGYVVPDRLAPAASNGRACRIGMQGECGPGAGCTAARIRTVGQTTWRYATPGRCVDTEFEFNVPNCNLDGRIGYQRVGMTCMGFPGETSVGRETALLTIRDCLRLREEALLQARPGEEVSQCWFSDQTIATTPAYPVGGCVSGDPMLSWGCGLGCDNCERELLSFCMFVSPTFGAGVCLPRTNPLTQTSVICKAQNPRMACPRGEACLFPVRGDRDGIPDRERTGICAPLMTCTATAGRLPRGYICDQTLVQ